MSAIYSGESDLLPTSPRAGAIPNKARGAAAPGLVKISQGWARPGVPLSSLTQGHLGRKEVTSVEREERKTHPHRFLAQAGCWRE